MTEPRSRRSSPSHRNTTQIEDGSAIVPELGNATCAECSALRAAATESRKDLQQALMELAQERELVNALRLTYPPTTTPAFVSVPGNGAPLRYVLVDQVNEGIKRVMGPLHGQTKNGIRRVLNLIRRPSEP